MKLIIIGNTNNFDIALSLIKNAKINILAGIVDTFTDTMADSQREFLKSHNIKEISFEDVENLKPDICLILTYNRIIPTKYFKNTILLNIHGGILPKWRGASTNAWAVINGEKEVGYSLHEATDELDGGDIYYICKSNIKPDEKYGKVIPILRRQMIDNLPSVLEKIASKRIKPVSQHNAKHIYTPRLRREDGIISNWSLNSQYIFNLYRVMSYPYGTGIFFRHKENLYEIREMSLVASCPDYIGTPGAIVHISENGMQVKTKNNVVEISKITIEDKEIDIRAHFKIGMRL